MLLASPITHTSPMSLGCYSKPFLLFGVLNLLSSGWPWFELRDQQQSEWLLPFHHSFTQTHLYLLHPPSISISSNSTHGAKDIFFPPYGYPWGNLLHQRSFNCNTPLVILYPQGCSLSRKAKSKHMKTLDRFLSSLFHILAIILVLYYLNLLSEIPHPPLTIWFTPPWFYPFHCTGNLVFFTSKAIALGLVPLLFLGHWLLGSPALRSLPFYIFAGCALVVAGPLLSSEVNVLSTYFIHLWEKLSLPTLHIEIDLEPLNIF